MAERDGQDTARERQRRHKRIGQLEAETNELIRMRAQELIITEEFIAYRLHASAEWMQAE
jgi:hypothetical protein